MLIALLSMFLLFGEGDSLWLSRMKFNFLFLFGYTSAVPPALRSSRSGSEPVSN